MSKYIGDVSAYAYAVSKGYTGTEEEFAELMADYANVGQRAEDAAESALNSKTAAQTAATTATNKASEATTAAQTATTKAQEAVANAEAAARDASQAMAAESMATAKASEATTAATTATTAKDDAVSAKTAAETAQGKAEDAQAAAERVAESIPSDYSQLSEDVSDLKEGLSEVIPTNSPTLTWEDGKVINVPNGGITNTDTMSMSRYNALNDYTELSVNWTYNNQYVGSVCFYEQTGASTYVKKGDIVTSVTADQKITVPDGATHFGVSRLTADKNGAQVTLYKSNIAIVADKVTEIENGITDEYDTESIELTWTSGKYIQYNGTIGNSSSFSMSNLIDVHDVDALVFNLSQSGTQYVAPVGFYKGAPSSQNYITGNIVGVSGFTKGVALQIPKGANYAVIGILTTNTSYLTVTAIKKDISRKVNYLTAKNEIGVCFGDSIINGVGVLPNDGSVPTSDVVTDMQRIMGNTMFNAGIGGTRMTDTADANFCAMVDAIVDNDWTDIDARIGAIIEQNPFFGGLTTTIGALKTLDFSTVDFIMVAYGTNDWAENKAIGEPTSTDKTEIYGAMKYAINKLLTAYPQLRVYFVSPGYRRDTGNTETDTHNGKTLAEYSADIAKASNSMGFPCLNLYNEGMVNRYNYAQFLADSVHRNIKGYELLAQQFCKLVHGR